MKNIKVNIGCGMNPTLNWDNYDNSYSIILSSYPLITKLLYKLQILNDQQVSYINFCKNNKIKWANASKHIPISDNTVDVLYSSHMLEHLDQQEACVFMKEAFRVLRPGGTIRIVVPDLARLVEIYNINRDANELIMSMHTCVPNAKSLQQRLRYALFGYRHHLWMYDTASLKKLLVQAGFENITSLAGGRTTIPDPNTLDLNERIDESIYLEGKKNQILQSIN